MGGDQRRPARNAHRQPTEGQRDRQPARKQHEHTDAGKDQRGAVVALDMNRKHRQQDVDEQQKQVARAVDPAAHFIEVPGQG